MFGHFYKVLEPNLKKGCLALIMKCGINYGAALVLAVNFVVFRNSCVSWNLCGKL